MSLLLLMVHAPQRIGSPILGIVIPAVILLISCWVTWALYKHFSEGDDGGSD